MKTKFLLSVLSIFLFGCSSQEYICFSNPNFKDEKLCYDHSLHKDNDDIALRSVNTLLSDLKNLGNLTKVKGVMKEHYSEDVLKKGLIKRYTNITVNNVLMVLSSADKTAIFFDVGSTLIYSHTDNAFVFSYDLPIEFAGAIEYVGNGYKPKLSNVSKSTSLCNLEKEGIMFISPNKNNFLYKENANFCSYNGMAFLKKENEVFVWPISEIIKLKQGSINQRTHFSKFLVWLNSNHNNANAHGTN